MRNFTPHSIRIIDPKSVRMDTGIRKYVPVGDEAVVIAELPSNGMLSAKIDTIPANPVDGIPTFVKKVTGCDPLPEGNDALIVSAIYAVAARQTGLAMDRLYIVADPVFTTDGTKVIGSLGVGPAM